MYVQGFFFLTIYFSPVGISHFRVHMMEAVAAVECYMYHERINDRLHTT